MKEILNKAASRIEYSPGHGPKTPDLMYNPLKNVENKSEGFWKKHRVLHIVLLVASFAAALGFVLFVSGL